MIVLETAMLPYEECHLVMLRSAVKLTHSSNEAIGWETNRTTLANILSAAGLDRMGRAAEDALLLLRNQGKIALQKIICDPPPNPTLTYRIAGISEPSSASQFFSGPFNIRVLPEGAAYLDELEAKKRAEVESAEMANRVQRKKRFAVGAHVLVGVLQRPGRVTYLADRPSTLGEYVHKVETGHGEETVLGCDMELVPEPITNGGHGRPVAGFRDVHLHGDNSRLNVNSTDNSTNVISQRNQSLFVEMRQTARQIGDEGVRDEIIGSIDELEKTQGQGGWTHAYERFVQLAAAHMTLFAPFLPALMHIATGLL
jgi:hypothetical protein